MLMTSHDSPKVFRNVFSDQGAIQNVRRAKLSQQVQAKAGSTTKEERSLQDSHGFPFHFQETSKTLPQLWQGQTWIPYIFLRYTVLARICVKHHGAYLDITTINRT